MRLPAQRMCLTAIRRLKDEGVMCFFYSCYNEKNLHAIVRRCSQGHTKTIRYCDKHIDHIMLMATEDQRGIHVGKPVCTICYSFLELVTEA